MTAHPQHTAQDPFIHGPIAAPIEEQLIHEEGFSKDYVEFKLQTHRDLIEAHLGKVGMALALTNELRYAQTPIIHGDQPEYTTDGPESHYLDVATDPEDKLTVDTAIVSDMLRTLGTTNSLRILHKGKDAGLDIGSMIRLLESDYTNVVSANESKTPERPELRYTEALLRSELALLWRPNMAGMLEDVRGNGFNYDISDPNVITPGKMAESDRKERWKTIGIKLFDDAANIFKSISESPTATTEQKLEALCRMTDLRVAELRIEMMRKGASQQEKNILATTITELNTAFLDGLTESVVKEPDALRDGKLFELWMTGTTRDKLLKQRDFMTTVRLALPREDNDHQEIPRLYNRQDKKYNLSADLIIEDVNGNVKKVVQLKAYPRARYDESETGKYLPKRTELQFEDDYPNNILEFRKAARKKQQEAKRTRR